MENETTNSGKKTIVQFPAIIHRTGTTDVIRITKIRTLYGLEYDKKYTITISEYE